MAATTQHVMTPVQRGALAGALGALSYLPVMLLLQPTVFATVAFALWPSIPQTLGEFLGWLLHVVLLVLVMMALAYVLRTVHDWRVLLAAGVGWSFLASWPVAFTAAMLELSWSLFGWMLESAAHLINGLVVGATLAYLNRLLPTLHET
jgi:hypothetical protein